MELFKASIIRNEQSTMLVLPVNDALFQISLTEDNPNVVKNIFNELIKALKKGEFNFELIDSKDDLYFQISKEYVTQLNVELNSIYDELRDYGLLDED